MINNSLDTSLKEREDNTDREDDKEEVDEDKEDTEGDDHPTVVIEDVDKTRTNKDFDQRIPVRKTAAPLGSISELLAFDKEI